MQKKKNRPKRKRIKKALMIGRTGILAKTEKNNILGVWVRTRQQRKDGSDQLTTKSARGPKRETFGSSGKSYEKEKGGKKKKVPNTLSKTISLKERRRDEATSKGKKGEVPKKTFGWEISATTKK